MGCHSLFQGIPGDLLERGFKSTSPALQLDSLLTEPPVVLLIFGISSSHRFVEASVHLLYSDSSFSPSLLPSFCKHLSNLYYIPGTVLAARKSKIKDK